jgi:phosphatidylserine/phosphatidylglycerophosphate/cardiolipin synthase-like enzyme
LDYLATVGKELSPDTVEVLSRNILRAAGPDDLVATNASTPRMRALLDRLREHWQDNPDLSAEALSLALLTAQRTAETVGRAQIIEVIWTGPSSASVPVRRTDQALYELIETAEREILIVSFAAYKVPRVIDALARALSRNVEIRFILESEGASGGRVSFDPSGALGELAERVQLYCWPAEKRAKDSKGRYGSLHAKCAVADRDLALFSSANLTEYALELNMECGLLVRGGAVPGRIMDHFRQLILKEVLRPVQAVQ